MRQAMNVDDTGRVRRPGGPGDPGAALPPASGASSGADPVLPMVLTPEELAQMLRVRRRSVYEAISRGDIPGVRRIGRKVRIDRDSVLAWMADGHGRAPRSSRR
jgi:excisionase family DNA binding protein